MFYFYEEFRVPYLACNRCVPRVIIIFFHELFSAEFPITGGDLRKINLSLQPEHTTYYRKNCVI